MSKKNKMTEIKQINFLDPPSELRRRGDAAFQIVPVPFEGTVSYGGGTSAGPRALLEASHQVEFFNRGNEPVRTGIYTHPFPEDLPAAPEDMIWYVQKQIATVVREKAIPVIIGGEHTVSVGAFKALAAAREKRSFGIVQFDAHADLRESYENTPLSHACVMHRALDMNIPIAQFGVRSLCREEADLRQLVNIPFHDAEELNQGIFQQPVLSDDFPTDIYITFDIDCLDPALVPATGTPEPGGLQWDSVVGLLENVIRERHVIGFDLVELAPVPGFHASEYCAAKLLYTIIGCIASGEKLPQNMDIALPPE